MKISLNWLKDYVETDLSAKEIADILSDLGFCCEGMEELVDDHMIDLEVTSNRGDCLGHIGVARELAAATGKELRLPEIKLAESEKQASEFTQVQIAEPDLCRRYTARIIEGVKVGPSPDWMVKRLEAIGIRSVNNVVDATNYAMLETGQPPHAFDYEKIGDGKIVVRKAAAGERLVSIDGTKCELDPAMLIIADSREPIALAGVMGGLDSEVSESTTSILLEDAYFDPVTVRTTSRKLSLPSDASFRFERIVDVEQIDWASKRTAQLITEVAGGKVAKGVVDTYPKRWEAKKVTLRLARLNKLLGIEIAEEKVVEILANLCFEPVAKNGVINCKVPSWRSDIYREVDLIEEIVRSYGYNKVPVEKKIKIEVVPQNEREELTKSIGSFLNSCGFYETINVTFTDNSTAEIFAGSSAEEHMSVKDVSRKDANLLRQSLLGSLFAVLQTNLNAKNTPCRIFEIADTFVPNAEGEVLPLEKTKLSIVCDSDLRDLRGVLEGLIGSFNKSAEVMFKPTELSWAEAGAEIFADDKQIGIAGIAGKKVIEKFDLDQVQACGAELELEALAELSGQSFKVKPIARFPAVERDLSIIVDEDKRWEKIADAVNEKASVELEDVRFVGIYRGKGISPGKKSVTLSLRFRDEEGTLTHETVDGFESKIVENLSAKVGAELRSV